MGVPQDAELDGDFTMLSPEELLTLDVDQLRSLISERREEDRAGGHLREREAHILSVSAL